MIEQDLFCELSTNAMEQIEEVCNQFEQQWRSGEPPRFEDFVGPLIGAERAGLVKHLVLLDFDYRQKLGQRPTLEDYRKQLPQDVAGIEEAFGKIEMDASGNLVTRSISAEQIAKTTGRTLHLNCPHCHTAMELGSEAALDKIVCPRCGSRFSLLGDDQPEAVTAGKTVGRFQLLEKLGVGGFGTVWRANDPEGN